MAPPIRIVILGTGDFALPTFEHLIATGHQVEALITQPDRPQGRKQVLVPASIKVKAQELGVPVHQPEDINAPEGIELVKSLEPDLLVTVAYGQILSSDVLAVPRLGGINLHGSILPKYRGAAPVARAIQHGESETGVTVIRMTPRVDAGGMIAVARTPIDPDETAGELGARLAQLGAPLVVECIAKLAEGTAEILPQEPSQATKAPKLRKDDGNIDWSQSVQQVHDLVRAMQPWPLASTHWHSSQSVKGPTRLIVHKTAVETSQKPEGTQPGQVIEAQGDRLIVAAGEGLVRLIMLQIPGKKPVSADAFLRGYPVQIGDRMGRLED